MKTAVELGDYTADRRMVLLSGLAVVVGAVGAGLSWVLLHLIFLCTNLFYFQRWSYAIADPGAHTLGWKAIFIPVIGGLLVGLIARFGSDKIRGHGMPEAIESVLVRGAKICPRVMVMKPLATAVAIGSGGPFGAEGPIIMTGGAAGSLLAQMMRMSDAERSTLLVAGAAAGMSATFLAPLSAILLAVELLLFEWRPRSLVPVAVASVTASALRRLILGPGPVFPTALHDVLIRERVMPSAVLMGLLAGLLAIVLSKSIYFFEDAFEKLPIHWMWWPAIGGLGIGLLGMIFPSALGVGYPVIQRMLLGDAAWHLILGVLIIKSLMWAFSLGSGTSGGILAPLLMIGCGLGAAMGHVLPVIAPGAWAMIAMAAVLAGAIGVPLTASMLAVELTHNSSFLLPVLLASFTSYGVNVLLQKRSILTERLARRGFHLSREYGVDPMETMTVREVMHTSVFALPVEATRQDAVEWRTQMMERGQKGWSHWQRLFPLVDGEGVMRGVLTRGQMVEIGGNGGEGRLAAASEVDPRVVLADATLKSAVDLMAESGLTMLPVVSEGGKLEGMIGLADLLAARTKLKKRESERVRVLQVRWPFKGRGKVEEKSI